MVVSDILKHRNLLPPSFMFWFFGRGTPFIVLLSSLVFSSVAYVLPLFDINRFLLLFCHLSYFLLSAHLIFLVNPFFALLSSLIFSS